MEQARENRSKGRSSVSCMIENQCALPALLRALFPSIFHGIRNEAKVQVDSRLVASGDIFIALPGNTTDGHLFLSKALESGAVGLIIRDDFKGFIPQGVPVARVPDTLDALQELARKKIQLASPRIIAVTGSVGKTTTKEFIRTLLQSENSVFSTSGNMNSQIGLSLSIINEAPSDVDWYVLEMGMTHFGNISRLVSIAPPDVALVTSIHLVHSQNFTGLDDIAKAKSEIFSSPKTSLRIANRDTNSFTTIQDASEIPMKTYSISRNPHAEWMLQRKDDHVYLYEKGALELRVKDPMFPADHIYDNFLAAVSAARSCGVSWKGIEKAAPELQLPPLRLEKVIKKGITFINDSYNASEPSMLSALQTLGKQSVNGAGRRIAVLGQMRELGKFSKECHERVGKKACEVADNIYCLGEEAEPIAHICEGIGKPCFWTVSFDELMKVLLQEIRADDVLLLKGSRSNQLWRVLDYYN